MKPTWKKNQDDAHRYFILRSKKPDLMPDDLSTLIREELKTHETLKEMNRQ